MKAFNKKLIAGALATTMVLSAGTAFAKGNGQDRNPAERLNYIFTQLEITEAQQTEILDIMQTLASEQREVMWDTMKELRDSEDRPTTEEMQAMRETNKAAQIQALTDQLNTVLSPQVTEELVEYLEAHGMGKMHGRDGQGHRGGDRDKGGRF
jgi:Spy/CpxP family protein refolding chaperone